jgi:hypothetical protein
LPHSFYHELYETFEEFRSEELLKKREKRYTQNEVGLVVDVGTHNNSLLTNLNLGLEQIFP